MNKHHLPRLRINVLMLSVIIGFQCVVMIYWGNQKDRLFRDELFTFETTASLFRDTSNDVDWKNQSNILNQTHTHEEFIQALTLMEEDELLNQPISQIIRSLAKGRTYFVLLNFVSSFQNDSLNIWYSIGLNIGFFVLAQICLYAICKKIFCNSRYGFAAVLIFGFSQTALVAVMYIRFYELYILLCMLHIYVHLCLLDSERVDWRYIMNIIFTLALTWIGYRNAEYMLIFAAVSALMYLFFCIKEKKKKQFLVYFALYSMAGIGFLTTYGCAMIASYYRGEGQMKTAVNCLLYGGLELFLIQLKNYIQILINYSGISYMFIFGILLGVIVWIKERKLHKEYLDKCLYLASISVLYLMIISKISPWVAWRYVSNIFPAVIVLCVAIFAFIDYSYIVKLGVLMAVTVLQIYQLKVNGPNLLSGGLNEGPSFQVREQINYLYSGKDSICFWDKQTRGDLYYAAFLWPDDTRVYLTTEDDFEDETKEKKEVLCNNKVLVWVRSEQSWNDSISKLMSDCGYESGECIYNLPESGWLLYECTRKTQIN